jgi:hypothetical protein
VILQAECFVLFTRGVFDLSGKPKCKDG